jgi:hypothetical protein
MVSCWTRADQVGALVARVRANLVRKRLAWCMIRVSSNLYLIAIGSLTSDDKKRAVAHELEHLRDLILKDLRRPPPPSSSF